MRSVVVIISALILLSFGLIWVSMPTAQAQNPLSYTLTPEDNLCFHRQPWDNLCNSSDPVTRDWQWRAGWYFYRYLNGYITANQIPREFYSLLVQMPTPRPTATLRPSATPPPNSPNYNSALVANPTANPRVKCGNGVIDSGEICDFAIPNSAPSGQSCNQTCTGFSSVCGDGVVVVGETCEDGNTVGGDGCSSTCQME